MKLYTTEGNPTGRKVWAVIKHLGLDVDIQTLSFEKGEVHNDAYKAINPNCMVPVLVDGDKTIWESNAINIYLCTEKKPDHPLFAPELRTQILQWLFWESAHYTALVRTVGYEIIIKQRFNLGEANPEIVKDAQEKFKRFASVLEQHLAERKFIVGDDWTLADYALSFGERPVRHLPFDLTSYPNLDAYYKRMAENPYWAATVDIGK